MTLPPCEPWRSCYDHVAPRLFLYARQCTGSAADAEDVVQTAFIRFWRSHPDAEPSHYPLLFAAVRSAAIDLARSHSRRVRRELATLDSAVSYFDSPPRDCSEAGLIEEALRALPPEQREVIVLHLWGELTFSQVAETMGTSLNTAASRYRYGLEALRRTLNPLHHELV